MRLLGLVLVYVLSVSLSGCAGAGHRVDNQTHFEPAFPDPLRLEEIQAFSQPGKEHEILSSFVGAWNHSVTVWGEPQDQPQEMRGTNVNSLVLGGRFLAQSVKGSGGDDSFEGIGYTGYDKLRGEYVSAWIDSFGTGIMTAAGQFDPATQTITEHGTYSDPATGVKDQKFKGLWRIISPDRYSYDLILIGRDGSERRSISIVYDRIKTGSRSKK